ncbi:MAG: tRNA (guanine-N7)-methyltransferase [Marmoricola sp.]|nr:tRNA (guanine-N7)-methyltransferase [Marmoricola sp.]
MNASPGSLGPHRAARPHTGMTAEGKRIREVVTYSRRGSRFTPDQAKAWEAHHGQWFIPDEAVDAADFSFASWFGRSAPLIVEIGCGIGEATAALAAARPEYDVLGFEVWRPGCAESMGRVALAGATNVRMISVDAVWSIEHLFAPDSIAELWTFFPDPWPKQKHHRRRLIQHRFAGVAASRLQPGGLWRLATDWGDYADQMAEVLDAEPLLEGGITERWADRPMTRFERRGVAEDRPGVDLTYRRA